MLSIHPSHTVSKTGDLLWAQAHPFTATCVSCTQDVHTDLAGNALGPHNCCTVLA